MMKALSVQAVLSFVPVLSPVAAPVTLLGAAQEAAPAPAAALEHVRRAAAELAAQGLVVDLGGLTVAVRTKVECRQAELAALQASFGPERADVYRLLLQAHGQEAESGEELLTKWAHARTRKRSVLYQPGARELALVEESLDQLGAGSHELLQSLALAARHQADPAVFEPPAGESMDAYLVRRALMTGGAMGDAQRALEARTDDTGFDDSKWLKALDLDRLEDEAWRQGLALRRGRSAPAREALWTTPPSSSEQLLHAIKLGQDLPDEVALPPWPDKLEGARLVFEDTLGELAILALLQTQGAARLRAEAASMGWDGDRLQHYVTAEGEDVLLWRTVWDRPTDAQQFAEEWLRRSRGQVLRRGRTVDWVLADSKGVWNRLLKSLDAFPHRGQGLESDGAVTARLEAETLEARRSAPYVVANEWRHPRLDLTVVVPVGWYEDELDGAAYMVRTRTAGFRDNIQVVTRRTPDAETIDGILAVNEALLRSDEEKEFISAEKRMLGDEEVGVLRFQSSHGAHQVIYSTLIILRDRRQTGVTVAVEMDRWAELHNLVEHVLINVRLGKVPLLEE